jgi:hypothetical protein
MTAKHRAAEHHASAAIHHEQAVRYHREASRHYQTGKDYAHAAHQALVAHGHALLAIDRGTEASKYYAEHDGNTLPKYPAPVPRFPAESLETPETMQTNLSGAEHHVAAADHHEQAAQHHRLASKHCDGKDYAMAVQEAQIAHRHAQHSVFNGNEAAKHHVEHYGKSGPTAEIS